MYTFVYVRLVIGFFLLRSLRDPPPPQFRGLVRTPVLIHWRAISKKCVFRERMWIWPKALTVLLSYLRRAM